jgi:hypothetical protein
MSPEPPPASVSSIGHPDIEIVSLRGGRQGEDRPLVVSFMVARRPAWFWSSVMPAGTFSPMAAIASIG